MKDSTLICCGFCFLTLILGLSLGVIIKGSAMSLDSDKITGAYLRIDKVNREAKNNDLEKSLDLLWPYVNQSVVASYQNSTDFDDKHKPL